MSAKDPAATRGSAHAVSEKNDRSIWLSDSSRTVSRWPSIRAGREKGDVARFTIRYALSSPFSCEGTVVGLPG